MLVIAGNLAGGYFAWANAVFTLMMLPVLDVLIPNNRQPNESQDDLIPNAVLIANSLVHYAAIIALLGAIHLEVLNGWFLVGAVISTGLNSGVAGITTAHELIHRKEKSLRNLGILNLLLVNYAHFYVEHVRGHHRYVGLLRDSATARKGESIYHFFIRTIPGQFSSAWKLENERLHKAGNTTLGLRHFILRSVMAQVLIVIAISIALGWIALVAYLGQSLIAVFLLEIVNYAEHYGLVRQPGQKFGPEHAWQSDRITSRFTLVELSRHTDHHLKASKHYQTLESISESPELPVGYFGMYYLILIPPIWFRIMNPRVDALGQTTI